MNRPRVPTVAAVGERPNVFEPSGALLLALAAGAFEPGSVEVFGR